MQVEGINYLIRDFDIKCWSSDHLNYLLKYSLPFILLWVIGFPLFVFIVLYKKRNNLNDKNTIL
jgi:hypothetical protein